MATGTTQLLASKEEIFVSSSEEEGVDGETMPIVPVPVKDGLPQVRLSGLLHIFSAVRVCFVLYVSSQCSVLS